MAYHFRKVCSFVVFYSFQAYGIETKHLTMQVGSQRTIQLPANDRVQVSKKGVVYLTHSERDNWIVTATHPGMVIVDAMTQKTSKKQYMINVSNTIAAPQKSQRSVKGHFSDVDDFLETRSDCVSDDNCTFNATLTDFALSDLEKNIQHSIGKRFDIKLDRHGNLRLRTFCYLQNRSELEKDVQSVIQSQYPNWQDIHMSCFEDIHEQRYQISGKIILAEDSDMEKFGLAPSGSFFSTTPTFVPAVNLTAQFQALIQDKKVNVVGEPAIEVNSGAPAVVKSGGEILMLAIDPANPKFAKAIWKEYGIQMTVTAFPSFDGKVRLDTDFSLRHRAPESSESQLTLSQIKTSVHSKIGTAFIAGSSSFQATGQSNQSIPILGKIPIIGPLFSQKQNDVLNSKLFLWMKVEELN